MPFDAASEGRRIAVIGAGISGLGAARLLSKRHTVTLFEAEQRLGGHARTVMAGPERDIPVDTGFIVFNYANYPHLTRLFEDLDAPVKLSDMTFGISLDDGAVEYGLKDARALFTQRSNMLRPRFLRMVRDILRFNARALEAGADPDLSLGDLLDRLGMGSWFRSHFMLPISGAIWSTPPRAMLDFPARALTQFFDNHNLLQTSGQHQWWTVDGGSIEYVRRIEAALREAGVSIRLGAPVKSVRREEGGAVVRAEGAEPERFDDVVFASHADQSLALLADPTGEERRIIGAFRFQPNRAYLHRDANQMPQRKGAWSSWNHRARTGEDQQAIAVTYWMNRLQGIPEETPLFVTLNPIDPIPDDLIYDQAAFTHPLFDHAAIAAQSALPGLQGARNTWWCGAWARHGFHEDGLWSAVQVADAMAARAKA